MKSKANLASALAKTSSGYFLRYCCPHRNLQQEKSKISISKQEKKNHSLDPKTKTKGDFTRILGRHRQLGRS